MLTAQTPSNWPKTMLQTLLRSSCLTTAALSFLPIWWLQTVRKYKWRKRNQKRKKEFLSVRFLEMFVIFFFFQQYLIIFFFFSFIRTGGQFQLFKINLDGTGLTQVTTAGNFNCFPMFSHDGKTLAWESDRAATQYGYFDVFVADWVTNKTY